MESLPPTVPEPATPATPWDAVYDWARRLGVRLVPLGLAGCALEMAPALDPRHDPVRFGAAPSRGDVLIVAGPVSEKMAPVIRRLWDDMPGPKWAVAFPCDGGEVTYPTYAVLPGIDHILPVDVQVPGDGPPRPEDLLAALQELERTRMVRPEVPA